MSNAPAPMNLEQFSETARAIEAEVKRVIVGQDEVVRSVLICILAGGHAPLEDGTESYKAAPSAGA